MLSTELFSLRSEINRLLDKLIARSNLATKPLPSSMKHYEEQEDSEGSSNESSDDILYESLYDSYAAGILRKNVRKSLGPLVPHPNSRHKVKVCLIIFDNVGASLRLGKPCTASLCAWPRIGACFNILARHATVS